MDFIVDFILSTVMYRIGLGILRVITFGRFPENNSYLKSLPILVGFIFIAVFIVILLLVISEISQ